MRNVNGSLAIIYNYCRRYAMIPLSLHLVPQEVQPGDNSKTFWVLKLRTTHSLIETQRYVRMPPEQVFELPPPDSEAPDDLTSGEVHKNIARLNAVRKRKN